ncbi:unnamed protein product [Linum tenue]|uniref:Uncharacterized protein n=1 Tax=Linum tenue TaxID=586396 RepID=A0AAV0L0S3_9ROSI|nr:unnamed protein product [Linum tenue]
MKFSSRNYKLKTQSLRRWKHRSTVLKLLFVTWLLEWLEITTEGGEMMHVRRACEEGWTEVADFGIQVVGLSCCMILGY